MANIPETGKNKLKAHVIECKSRTDDIVADEEIPFSSLLLSGKVLDGLSAAGYEKPSPIQLKAIPLAKCGLDMVVQAKSGTGKTCVFTVAALESLQTDNENLQVLILAPTREIASQIHDVITAIGSSFERLNCEIYIGGTSMNGDKKKLKKSQIAVGTPGRIKQLIDLKWLNTDSVRLFILDEADKLLEEGSFQEQINWIFSTLPENKQVLALSATYPGSMDSLLINYMNSPVHVRLTTDGLTLAGVKQFYNTVPEHHLQHVVFERKVKLLVCILEAVSFQQCLVFSNYQTRAENLCHMLISKGWPSAYISGSQAQQTRQKTMEQLRDFKCRVLISTDLISRGIDCDKINLVINLDLPWDTETYLHRIGRAGRFGAYGLAISLITEETEKKKLDLFSKEIGLAISRLPENLNEISDVLALMQDASNNHSHQSQEAEESDDAPRERCRYESLSEVLRLSPDGEHISPEESSGTIEEENKSNSTSVAGSLSNGIEAESNGGPLPNDHAVCSNQEINANHYSGVRYNPKNVFTPDVVPHSYSDEHLCSSVDHRHETSTEATQACPFCLIGNKSCCTQQHQDNDFEFTVDRPKDERDHPDGCDEKLEGSTSIARYDEEEDGNSGHDTSESINSLKLVHRRQFEDLVNANVHLNVENDDREGSTSSVGDSGIVDWIAENPITRSTCIQQNTISEFSASGAFTNRSVLHSDSGLVGDREPVGQVIEQVNCQASETAIPVNHYSGISGINFGAFTVNNVLPLMSELNQLSLGTRTISADEKTETEKSRLPSEVEFERVLGRFIKSSKLEDLTDDPETTDNVFKGSDGESDVSADTDSQCDESESAESLHGSKSDIFSSDNEESCSTESTKSAEDTKTHEPIARERIFSYGKRKALSNLALPSVYRSEESVSSSYDSESEFDSSSESSDVDRNTDIRQESENSRSSITGTSRREHETLSRNFSIPDGYRSDSENSSEKQLDELILIPMESPKSAFAETKKISQIQNGSQRDSSSFSSSSALGDGENDGVAAKSMTVKSDKQPTFSYRPSGILRDRARRHGTLTGNGRGRASSLPPWVQMHSKTNHGTISARANVDRMMTAWGNSYLNYCHNMNSYVKWARSVREKSFR